MTASPIQVTSDTQAVVPQAGAGAGAEAGVLPDQCEWQGYGQGSVAGATCQPTHWLSHAAVLCADFGGKVRGPVFADQSCSVDADEVQVQCCFNSAPPPAATAPSGGTLPFEFMIVPGPDGQSRRNLVFAEAEQRCARAITDRFARYTDPLHHNVRALHFSCRR